VGLADIVDRTVTNPDAIGTRQDAVADMSGDHPHVVDALAQMVGCDRPVCVGGAWRVAAGSSPIELIA
jgi:hypothetical protein